MARRTAPSRRRDGAAGAVRRRPRGLRVSAALQYLAIIDAAKARDGRARLGEINRASTWRSGRRATSHSMARSTLDLAARDAHKGRRDCEDYAIAKFVALRKAGIAPDDLRIVIMHSTISGEDHAVAAARLDATG